MLLAKIFRPSLPWKSMWSVGYSSSSSARKTMPVPAIETGARASPITTLITGVFTAETTLPFLFETVQKYDFRAILTPSTTHVFSETFGL